MAEDGDTEAQNPNISIQKAACSKLRKAALIVAIYALFIILSCLWPFTAFLFSVIVFIIVCIRGTAAFLSQFFNTETQSFGETKQRLESFGNVAVSRVGCLCLLSTVVFLTIPSLKKVTILGSLLWKWSVLVDVIPLGYPFLLINTVFLTSTIDELNVARTFIEYGIDGGLLASIRLLLYLSAILVTWLVCVGTSLGGLHKYGTLTLVSFIVGAVLSVMKKLALLWWKAKYIFPKYKGKILAAWFHLYFFHKIHPYSRFTENMTDLGLEPMEFCDPRGVRDNEDRKIRPIERYMSERKVSAPKLEETVSCLRKEVWRAQMKTDGFSHLREEILGDRESEDRNVVISEEPFEKILQNEEESKILFKMLRLDLHKADVTYDELENWMLLGLKSYYWDVHRINGAHGALGLLDRILTGLIVVLVILTWIFITGLATTNVVVALASLFVGLSFMFGDTRKTFFQGVIFSFITHPFDVGDRCVIDDKELEVTKINVLTTTFLENQRKEIVLYPSSDLATKRITKVQGEPVALDQELEKEQMDLDDIVEFNLPSWTTIFQIKSLQKHIQKCVDGDVKNDKLSNKYGVTADQIGGNLMGVIRFKHMPDEKCAKDELNTLKFRGYEIRSSLLLEIKQFLEGPVDQGCRDKGNEPVVIVSEIHPA